MRMVMCSSSVATVPLAPSRRRFYRGWQREIRPNNEPDKGYDQADSSSQNSKATVDPTTEIEEEEGEDDESVDANDQSYVFDRGN